MTTLYSDGLINISIRDGVAKLELFNIKTIKDKEQTKETLEHSGNLILSVAGLIRFHEQMLKTIHELEEKGLIVRKDTN